VFSNDYCYPSEFSHGESYETDDAFISDESLETFNAKEKMAAFENYIQD